MITSVTVNTYTSVNSVTFVCKFLLCGSFTVTGIRDITCSIQLSALQLECDNPIYSLV